MEPLHHCRKLSGMALLYAFSHVLSEPVMLSFLNLHSQGCLAIDLLVFVLMGTGSWYFGGRISKRYGLCGSSPNPWASVRCLKRCTGQSKPLACLAALGMFLPGGIEHGESGIAELLASLLPLQSSLNWSLGDDVLQQGSEVRNNFQ